MESKIGLFLLLVTLFSCLVIQEATATKDKVSDLSKSYDKINKHLLKHVNSDDPEANMVEMSNWRNSKLLKLRGGHLLQAVNYFLMMPAAVSNETICYNGSGSGILERNDEGLFNPMRLEQDNYSLQRIDKIIHYYYEKYIFLCAGGSKLAYKPDGAFGWKRIAYEKINKFMTSKEISGKESKLAMNALKEWLKTLEKENSDGALTDAVRQVVSLESAIGEYKCSRKAHEILYKNELATEPRYVTERIREIQFLVRHYLVEHAKLCKDIYPKKLQDKIEQLDDATLRSVLIMTSEFYFGDDKFKKLSKSIAHTEYLQINPDFTSPEIVELMTKATPIMKNHNGKYELFRRFYTTSFVLFQSLKIIMNKSDPNYKYLSRVEDEQTGQLIVKKDKIQELHREYLLEPCKKFKKALDGEVLFPAKYDDYHYDFAVKEEEFIPRLGFMLAESASSICNIVERFVEKNIEQFYDLVRYTSQNSRNVEVLKVIYGQ